MLAGSYTLDITPTPPVDLNGYILRFGQATGVHDPLTANFLYIESNGKKILLISLDILTISTELAHKLRSKIANLLDIDRDAILLAAIHTHSAVGSPYLRNGGEESAEWRKDFEEKIIVGSLQAEKSVAVAEISAYEAFSSVGINRRKKTRGIDPNAPFMVIKNGEKIIAWLINYNCHPVSLTESNLLISADYVHYLREYIYANTNQRFPILFFNGGSGDVDPVKRGSFEAAQFTGEKLGEEILLAYQTYPGEKIIPKIKYTTGKLEIPYSWNPGVAEAERNLAQHTELLNESKTKEDIKINKAFHLWAEDLLALVKNKQLPESLITEISLIKLGKALFISAPLELFSSISLKLRKMFGDGYPFIVSYGNGYSGYLSDKTAFTEGGYEVEQWHKYAGILPQAHYAEDIFREKISELDRELNKQAEAYQE